MNKRKLLSYALLAGMAFSSIGCSGSYKKSLERIVKEDHASICSSVNNKSKELFFRKQLILELSEDRKINLETYNSENSSANIILLSTLGEPASSLSLFSSEIAGYGYNVYAIDIEGFGKSTGDRGKIFVPKIEEDISKTIEFIKSQNNQKIVLAGTSIGSEFSLLYSVEGKYKEEVEAVIAHGSFVPSLGKDFDLRSWLCRNPLNKPIIKLLTHGKLNILHVLGKKNFYNNLKEIEQITSDEDYITRINTGTYIDFINYKPKNKITSYRRPILFVISKDDGMIPFKHSIHIYDSFKKENPNVFLYIPEGRDRNREVPHMAFDTNYKEIAEEIDCFLKRALK